MNRLIASAAIVALLLSSSTPAFAQGWNPLPSWTPIGLAIVPINSAEAAAMFRNSSQAGWIPPTSPGTALVNDNGINNSQNGLWNLATYSRSVFLAFDYARGLWNVPGIQTYFGNADKAGQSSFRVDMFPPGTGMPSHDRNGNPAPLLVVRLEDPPTLDFVWVVPNMINNTGSYVPHNVLISIFADSANTFHIQVAQDNSMYAAFLADPATLQPEKGVPNNQGPTGDDFTVPWRSSNEGILTYYTGNRLIPTKAQGVYQSGATFDGFPNDYYAVNGPIGRVVFWPNAPVDIRPMIINHTFEGPSPDGTTPGAFTILPKGGAGVMFGTPSGVNNLVPAGGSVQPSIYLIGGMTYPALNSILPSVIFSDNQGYVAGNPGIDTSFYMPQATVSSGGSFVPPVSVPTTFFLGDMPQ